MCRSCDIAHTTESNKKGGKICVQDKNLLFPFPRHFFYDYVKMAWSEFINRSGRFAVPGKSFNIKSNGLTYGLKKLKFLYFLLRIRVGLP